MKLKVGKVFLYLLFLFASFLKFLNLHITQFLGEKMYPMLSQMETRLTVNLADSQTVHIFKSKYCVHKTNVGINIRHSEGMGLTSNMVDISFTRSLFVALASDSYCAIRTSEVFPRKPRISPNYFWVMPFRFRKNLIRLPIAIMKAFNIVLVAPSCQLDYALLHLAVACAKYTNDKSDLRVQAPAVLLYGRSIALKQIC